MQGVRRPFRGVVSLTGPVSIAGTWVEGVAERVAAIIARGMGWSGPNDRARRIAREILRDLVPLTVTEASRRASAGYGFTSGPPWFREEDMLLTGSPDRHAGHMVADFGLMGDRAEDIPSDEGCGLSEASDDARFAALAWTFVRRLIAEQDAREKLL